MNEQELKCPECGSDGPIRLTGDLVITTIRTLSSSGDVVRQETGDSYEYVGEVIAATCCQCAHRWNIKPEHEVVQNGMIATHRAYMEIPKSQVERIHEVLDGEGEGNTRTVQRLSTEFPNSLKVGLFIVVSDPPYVEATLFEPHGLIRAYSPKIRRNQLLGEYRFRVGNDQYVLHVREGEEWDKEMFEEYLTDHGYGPPTEEAKRLARELFEGGDTYSTVAHEVVSRDMTKEEATT